MTVWKMFVPLNQWAGVQRVLMQGTSRIWECSYLRHLHQWKDRTLQVVGWLQSVTRDTSLWNPGWKDKAACISISRTCIWPAFSCCNCIIIAYKGRSSDLMMNCSYKGTSLSRLSSCNSSAATLHLGRQLSLMKVQWVRACSASVNSLMVFSHETQLHPCFSLLLSI